MQAVEVARTVTGEKHAVTQFRETLKDRKMNYFNAEKIPDNESDATAHRLCSTVDGAMKFCPKRWEALEKWKAFSSEVHTGGGGLVEVWDGMSTGSPKAFQVFEKLQQT